MLNPLMQITAGIKHPLSFTKKHWQLSDYPIRIRRLRPSADESATHRLIPWSAQIINWWQMNGTGDTKDEAYADLESQFAKVKEGGESLPRPGTGLPIEFASRERVSLYDDLAEDFF